MIQCGICVKTCPEKVISLKPQINLADSSMSSELKVEDKPFPCKVCGKILGHRNLLSLFKNDYQIIQCLLMRKELI